MIAPHVTARQFLGSDVAVRLLSFVSRRGHGAPTRIGYGAAARIDPAQRVSEYLGDLDELKAPVEQRILAHADPWREQLGIAPFEITQLEFELVRHGDGAFFSRHIDIGGGGRRVMSIVYYFHAEPKAFTGGLLRLFAPDATAVDIEPECDLAVAFPSFLVHEVTQVRCPSKRFIDSRFAINCWLLRDSPTPAASHHQ